MTSGSAPGRAADRARTIFFGSGAFAVPILDALAGDRRLELVAVVSAPDRPAGRSHEVTPTPVAARAATLRIPLVQPARVRAPEAIAELTALQPDLGVLADYGQIVPRPVLDLPPHGILNIHPSLLPRHRGATPIAATIASGDDRAGVTIIRMDDGIDTGPIVARQSWPLSGAERAPDLEAHAAREGAELLTRTIDPWLAGTAPAIPQTPAARRSRGRSGATMGGWTLIEPRSSWSGRCAHSRHGRGRSSRRRLGGWSSTRPRSGTPSRATSEGPWFATAIASRW